MGLAVCSIIRNSFLALKAERSTSEALRLDITKLKDEPLLLTAPQVELDSETTSDYPMTRLLLRNISQTEPIFNIYFQPVRPGTDIYVSWIAGNQAVLQPMTQMPIGPLVMKANGQLATEFKGVYSIVELLKKEKVASAYNIGPVSFSCEDRAQNRYLVTFTVEVSFSARTMRVVDLDRRRIGSRPSWA
jgi:hypothetical protein